MKKGMTPAVLVALIALAATTLVLMAVLAPVLVELLFGSAEKAMCSMELVLSNVAETDQIKGCEMHNVIVTPEDLSNLAPTAEDEYYNLRDKGLLTRSLEMSFDPIRFPVASEAWALNSIIGKEMVDCYERVKFGEKVIAAKKISTPGLTTAPPILCVACARIALTEEAKEVFRGSAFDPGTRAGVNMNIKTQFDYWVKNVPYKKEIYSDTFEKAFDEAEAKSKTLVDAIKVYHPDPMRAMTVVLVSAAMGTWGWDGRIQYINVYPYDDMTKPGFVPYFTANFVPHSGEEMYPETAQKCDVIIQ